LDGLNLKSGCDGGIRTHLPSVFYNRLWDKVESTVWRGACGSQSGHLAIEDGLYHFFVLLVSPSLERHKRGLLGSSDAISRLLSEEVPDGGVLHTFLQVSLCFGLHEIPLLLLGLSLDGFGPWEVVIAAILGGFRSWKHRVVERPAPTFVCEVSREVVD